MADRAWAYPPLPRPEEGTIAQGFVHELGVYRSDDEFRQLVAPFALGGLDAGEPVLFAYDAYKTELLRRWLPRAPGIFYVSEASSYATPAKALAAWRRAVEDRLDAGARRVRIAGNVPHPGVGQPYAGWDRYEAALDRALGDLPVWAPCLYDVRIAPADVLMAAGQLHRYLLDHAGTHRANERFDPCRRLADFLAPAHDPLESTTPAFEAVDPTPQALRPAVRRATRGLAAEQQSDLLLAATEVVTNALLHGVPPVRVRIWSGDGRVVVRVDDRGAGPADPCTGLLPPQELSDGGRGLWLVHQLDLDVALSVERDGFAVRLGAGRRSDSGA